MSRVLFLANLNPNKFGSLEEQVLFLGAEMSRRGHELFFGTICSPAATVAEKLTGAGIRMLTIPHGSEVPGGILSRLRQARHVRQILREYRIDLVHINLTGLTDPALLGFFLSSVKIIYTDHFSGATVKRSGLKKLLARIVHGVIAYRVARYVGVSEFVRNRLQATHYVPSSQTETIYNGVNVARFAPGARSTARQRLGITRQGKVLLSVAMLIPEKGVQHLLYAAATLIYNRHAKDLIVLLAGEGRYQPELQLLAGNLGISDHVIFLGRRNDVETLIAAADIVVVPSVWEEAFGLIVAEAMAGGRPVVASNVGGIPELIKDRDTGLLVEAGSNHEIAEGILELLTDQVLYLRLAENALLNVRRQFDIIQQVGKLYDLYGKIIDGESLTQLQDSGKR